MATEPATQLDTSAEIGSVVTCNGCGHLERPVHSFCTRCGRALEHERPSSASASAKLVGWSAAQALALGAFGVCIVGTLLPWTSVEFLGFRAMQRGIDGDGAIVFFLAVVGLVFIYFGRSQSVPFLAFGCAAFAALVTLFSLGQFAEYGVAVTLISAIFAAIFSLVRGSEFAARTWRS